MKLNQSFLSFEIERDHDASVLEQIKFEHELNETYKGGEEVVKLEQILRWNIKLEQFLRWNIKLGWETASHKKDPA